MQGEDFSTRIHDIERIQHLDWFTSETLTGVTTIPAESKIKTFYTNGNFTVTLPETANCHMKRLQFYNISASDVTISVAGADTFNGVQTSIVMRESLHRCEIVADGDNNIWYILFDNFNFTNIKLDITAGNQLIAPTTLTYIQFDNVVKDWLGEWDPVNYIFEPLYPGDYFYTIVTLLHLSADQKDCTVRLCRKGANTAASWAAFFASNTNASSGTRPIGMSMSTIEATAIADDMIAMIYHNQAGGGQNLNGTTTFMNIVRVDK